MRWEGRQSWRAVRRRSPLWATGIEPSFELSPGKGAVGAVMAARWQEVWGNTFPCTSALPCAAGGVGQLCAGVARRRHGEPTAAATQLEATVPRITTTLEQSSRHTWQVEPEKQIPSFLWLAAWAGWKQQPFTALFSSPPSQHGFEGSMRSSALGTRASECHVCRPVTGHPTHPQGRPVTLSRTC